MSNSNFLIIMDENVSDCETVFDVEINVHDVGSYEEPKIEARY